VVDINGFKPHLPLVVSEGRDETGVLGGLLGDLFVAAEVPAETDLRDDGSCIPVDGGRVWRGSITTPPGVDEVRGCALTLLKK
jgi:hypothetical protein